MALLFGESFNGWGTVGNMAAKYYGSIGLGTPARTGSVAANGEIGRNVVPATDTLIMQGAFYMTGVAAHDGFFAAGNIAAASITNYQWQVYLNATSGTITMYRGSTFSGTILQTSAICLAYGAWNYIEVKIKCATSGTWVVNCNGVQVLSGSGNTSNFGSPFTLLSAIARANFNSRVADWIVMDSSGSYLNDLIGEHKIENIRPLTDAVGAGANAGLTPSTGTDHGALVDETTPNTTDWNGGTTAGVKDTYQFGDLAATGAVAAVIVTLCTLKPDTGPKTHAPVVRIAGTDYDGTTVATPTGALVAVTQQIYEKKPSDATVWTALQVNAVELGMKVVA